MTFFHNFYNFSMLLLVIEPLLSATNYQIRFSSVSPLNQILMEKQGGHSQGKLRNQGKAGGNIFDEKVREKSGKS